MSTTTILSHEPEPEQEQEQQSTSRVMDNFAFRPQCWMGDLFPEEVRHAVSLPDILVPGTHNAGAYMFSPELGVGLNSTTGSAASHALTGLGSLRYLGLGAIGNLIARKFAICQELTIYEQLNKAGVRYLDLRVSFDPDGDRFVVSHTLACVLLDTVIADIHRFVQEQSSEVVVVRVDWDHYHRVAYQQQPMAKVRLAKYLAGDSTLLGPYLLDFPGVGVTGTSPDSFPSLSAMINHRIILLWRVCALEEMSDLQTEDPTTMRRLWDNTFFAYSSDSTDDLQVKRQSIASHLSRLRDASPDPGSRSSIINVLDCTLTPQGEFVKQSLTPLTSGPKTVADLAASLNPLSQFRELWRASVVTSDFVLADVGEFLVRENLKNPYLRNIFSVLRAQPHSAAIEVATSHPIDSRILSGAQLAAIDKCSCYEMNCFYLTLPESNCFLFLNQATGYVVLQNRLDEPIEIEAQRRRGRERGRSAILEKGNIFKTDFRGHWVIRIVKGQPSGLEVNEVATKGGGKGDKLGMY